MHNLVRIRVLPLIFCGVLLGACRAPAGGPPSVEFSRVPRAEAGGTEKLDDIEGRVEGARPGQRIVLYARSGAWYVQPFADHPFTEIRPDSTWKSPTHLGTDYAALLVEPGYSPPARADELPGPGGGVVAVAAVPGVPVFWQRWWFRVAAALALVFVLLAFYRQRLRQLTRQLNLRFEERLVERTRIAQELHDTLLQDFLSVSMQLHVVAENLPEGSPARSQLGHIQQLMGRVVDEGRNTVRGLRGDGGAPTELEEAFTRAPQELGAQGRIDYQVTVGGRARPLHPIIRDEVYRIGREALVNAFRRPRVTAVRVEVEYTDARLRLFVRDEVDRTDASATATGPEGHPGLAKMRERAERIGGRLRVRSRSEAATEIMLSVPGDVAFRTESPARGWFGRSFGRKARAGDREAGGESDA